LNELDILNKPEKNGLRYPEKINSRIIVLPWQQFCARLWKGDIV